MIRFEHFSCACFHSATVAWSYFLGVVSVGIETLLQFPDISNTLGLQQYLPAKTTPFYMFGIAAITLMARLRSIIWRQRPSDVQV